MDRSTIIQIVAGAVGIFALLKVLEGTGLYESPGTTKRAAKWRNLPELKPDYYRYALNVKNVIEAANLIYDQNDQPRLDEAKRAILEIYNSKGVLSDDESKAVSFLKTTIRSKIELSIFADLFKNLPVITAVPFSVMGATIPVTTDAPTGKDFAQYLDTFLENTYQADLFKWFKGLPYATEKQKNLYKARTGKEIKPPKI